MSASPRYRRISFVVRRPMLPSSPSPMQIDDAQDGELEAPGRQLRSYPSVPPLVETNTKEEPSTVPRSIFQTAASASVPPPWCLAQDSSRPIPPQGKSVSNQPTLLHALGKLGVRRIARTVDWDILSDRAAFTFEGTMVTAAEAARAIGQDDETRDILRWAVLKLVRANIENGRFVRGSPYRGFDDFAESAYEHFVAELGHALVQFCDGPHFTYVDIDARTPAQIIRSRALRILDCFASLGHERTNIIISIPATCEAMEATRLLTTLDGVRVSLVYAASVALAAACAAAGAEVVSMPLKNMFDWQRLLGNTVESGGKTYPAVEEVQTAAAYFHQHGIESAIIVDNLESGKSIWEIASVDMIAIGREVRDMRWPDTYPSLLAAPPPTAQSRAAALAFSATVLEAKDGFYHYMLSAEESTVNNVLYRSIGADSAHAAVLRAAVRVELARQINLSRFDSLPPSFTSHPAETAQGDEKRKRPTSPIASPPTTKRLHLGSGATAAATSAPGTARPTSLVPSSGSLQERRLAGAVADSGNVAEAGMSARPAHIAPRYAVPVEIGGQVPPPPWL